MAKNAPFPAFPAGVVDQSVQKVVDELRAKALEQRIPFEDLIVTRKGAPNQGNPNNAGELRIIFTEGDALAFKECKPIAQANMTQIEDLQKENDENKQKLSKLGKGGNFMDTVNYIMFSWTGVTMNGKGDNYAQNDAKCRELREAQVTLGAKLSGFCAEFKEKVFPGLKQIQKSTEGYVEVKTVRELLDKDEFNVSKGSGLSYLPRAFWWIMSTV